eukprot:GFYU01017484.1.p1 GENE.GFYU01017484.1~~GFYU01017484.1.p1  ORF type:complete len:180 (-),score=48.10 GFYU01017484.1:163-702(-)
MPESDSFFNLSAVDIDGHTRQMKEFSNELCFVINIGTECKEFGERQMKELQELHEMYKDKGLRILAFPSNQYNESQPQDDAEIANIVRNTYQGSYTLFQKVECIGPERHQIYRFLEAQMCLRVDHNFAKFLIDEHGQCVQRWYPKQSPMMCEPVLKGFVYHHHSILAKLEETRPAPKKQ